jgi:hypothetical protein
VENLLGNERRPKHEVDFGSVPEDIRVVLQKSRTCLRHGQLCRE